MAISRKLLNPGEQVVFSTRTHVKALLLPVLALLVLLVIGVVVTVWSQTPWFVLGVWILVVIGILWWFVWPFLTWLSATYTVTNRRLITRSGVLTRRGHDIPLNRISDVSYERDLLDRMLGCGTLVVSDASTRGRVALPDVPDVERLHLQLTETLQGTPNADDGT